MMGYAEFIRLVAAFRRVRREEFLNPKAWDDLPRQVDGL
jgi:protein-L-isoaspartate O-methyltransferase